MELRMRGLRPNASGDAPSFTSLNTHRWAVCRPCAFRPCVPTWRLRLVPRALHQEGGGLGPLERELDAAILREDYEQAAVLRDKLREQREGNLSGVLQANAAFYKAFGDADLPAMEAVWGKSESVQVIHPVAGCIAGRDQVLSSWQLILEGGALDITIHNVRAAATDTIGWVTCLEATKAGSRTGRVLATNIFQREGSGWKLVHHHGSII
uniref:F-box protein SKIP8 n=1 Tax=Auxenochlorella protothecoides TaxID=3075 RepID=A0A1D2A882_AUXPR